MSSTAPSLPKFIVWAPDYTDDGALQRRLAVRPSHIESLQALIRQGTLRVGGAFMTPESVDPSITDKAFIGSCMIFEAENIDVVRRLVEEDIYYKSGVWDKDRLVIFPMALATGLPPIPS